MLAPIEWKQSAGYPAAAFCATHDRLIEPIKLTDAEGTASWGCPYCAEEDLPQLSAKPIEPERPQGFSSRSAFYSSSVRYWCPQTGCHYNTTLTEAMQIHKKVMHTASGTDKMKCAEGLCDKDADDFCAQCESAMCKDHLDWHGMCPACGSMWPYS